MFTSLGRKTTPLPAYDEGAERRHRELTLALESLTRRMVRIETRLCKLAEDQHIDIKTPGNYQ